MKKYSEKLLDPRWQKKRLEILERDRFKCVLCSDGKSTIHVHHIRYENGLDPWDYSNDSLITLCEHCHGSVHSDDNELSRMASIAVSFYEMKLMYEYRLKEVKEMAKDDKNETLLNIMDTMNLDELIIKWEMYESVKLKYTTEPENERTIITRDS